MQFFTPCFALSNKENTHKVFQDSGLTKKVNLLSDAFNKKDYLKFYKLFPFSITAFAEIYGFNDTQGESPLYENSFEHINFLFQFNEKIDMQIFADKIFEFVKTLKWEADGINYFQNNLIDFIKREPNGLINVLKSKSKNEIYCFWHLVFDGSSTNDLQNKNNFQTLYNSIKSIDIEQSSLLKNEFDKMYP